MNDFNKTLNLQFGKILNKNDIRLIEHELKKVDGIVFVDIKPETAEIEYIPFKLTGETIKGIITNIGFDLDGNKKNTKGILQRFVDNLAKSNKNAFGSKKLDCCELKQNQ